MKLLSLARAGARLAFRGGLQELAPARESFARALAATEAEADQERLQRVWAEYTTLTFEEDSIRERLSAEEWLYVADLVDPFERQRIFTRRYDPKIRKAAKAKREPAMRASMAESSRRRKEVAAVRGLDYGMWGSTIFTRLCTTPMAHRLESRCRHIQVIQDRLQVILDIGGLLLNLDSQNQVSALRELFYLLETNRSSPVPAELTLAGLDLNQVKLSLPFRRSFFKQLDLRPFPTLSATITAQAPAQLCADRERVLISPFAATVLPSIEADVVYELLPEVGHPFLRKQCSHWHKQYLQQSSCRAFRLPLEARGGPLAERRNVSARHNIFAHRSFGSAAALAALNDFAVGGDWARAMRAAISDRDVEANFGAQFHDDVDWKERVVTRLATEKSGSSLKIESVL